MDAFDKVCIVAAATQPSITDAGSSARLRWPVLALALIGFVLGAIAAYATILDNYFLSDDFCLIGRAARDGFFGTWRTPNGGFVRPIIVLSYMADFALWRFNPLGYHLTNVAVHGANAFLIFLIMRRVMRLVGVRESLIVPLVAGALFLFHPSHTESVTWIAGRTDVIATFFGLLATCCFLRLVEQFRWLEFLGFVASFAAALASKESVIVLPIVWSMAFGAIWLRDRRPAWPGVGLLLSSFVVLLVYFPIRKALIGEFVGGYGTVHHLSIFQRTTAINAAYFTLRTALPALPSALYRFCDHGVPLFCLVVAPIAAGLLLIRRRDRFMNASGIAICVLVASFAASLVPVVNLYISLFDTEGERLLYLPSALAAMAVALMLSRLVTTRPAVVSIAIIFILVEAATLVHMNQRWIVASRMTRAIACEVSRYDPTTTAVLNVPDNYQGAFVFREGLNQAATFFEGKEPVAGYFIVAAHDVHTLDDAFGASLDEDRVRFSTANPRRVRKMDPAMKSREWQGDNFVATLPDGLRPIIRRALSYRGGISGIEVQPVANETPIRTVARPADKNSR